MVAAITLEEGLDYILSHFEGQRLWPRAISTKTTEGRQVVVNSIEEALARFTQSDFLDCRISAYPLAFRGIIFCWCQLGHCPQYCHDRSGQRNLQNTKSFRNGSIQNSEKN